MANLAQNSCKSPDQISSFAKKCNLFSQYLKEKGSFGDISLGINGKAPEVKGTLKILSFFSFFFSNADLYRDVCVCVSYLFFCLMLFLGPETSGSPATTLNLLTNMENSSEHITFRQKPVASSNTMKSMDFFPQFVGFSPSNYTEDAINKAGNHLRYRHAYIHLYIGRKLWFPILLFNFTFHVLDSYGVFMTSGNHLQWILELPK